MKRPGVLLHLFSGQDGREFPQAQAAGDKLGRLSLHTGSPTKKGGLSRSRLEYEYSLSYAPALMRAGIWETKASSRMYKGRRASKVRDQESLKAYLQPMNVAATNQMDAIRLPNMGTIHSTNGAEL